MPELNVFNLFAFWLIKSVVPTLAEPLFDKIKLATGKAGCPLVPLLPFIPSTPSTPFTPFFPSSPSQPLSPRTTAKPIVDKINLFPVVLFVYFIFASLI